MGLIMKASEFCYWLQGWFELNETIDHRGGAAPETLEMIKRHLGMVFKHDLDKQHGDWQHQQQLQAIHDGKNSSDPDVRYRC